MSARELSEELGLRFGLVRAKLGYLKTQGRVHIHSYCRDTENGRLYPRARWALGSGKDAKRPAPLSDAEYNRRYRERTRGLVNSVFELAGNNSNRRVGPATGVC